MTKIRFVGDLHGHLHEFKLVVENTPKEIDKIIQVGDFGIGFGQSDYWHESLNDYMIENNIYFLRGNHDNPGICKTMNTWIKDGMIENDVMLIGGAWSIDWAYRREGYDWWKDEELSIGELSRLYDIYVAVKPRVMITHDAPTDVTYEMFVQSGLAIGGPNAKKIQTRTGQAFQAMFDAHQPDFHFFGHWHHSMAYQYGRTTFVCLGELDYIDVDLEDSDQIHEAITSKFS